MAKKPTISKNDTPVGALTAQNRMAALNKWREAYNPLRGLTIPRAVSMLEEAQRGILADLQWAYFFIEQSDADLFALIERRSAAILELDWDIKTPEDTADTALAEDQAACLREAYDRIDNLEDALEHLVLATFRGYSHLEKHRNTAGDIIHLEPLDQWNVVRNGRGGDWKYNPEARLTSWDSLPESNILVPGDWIVRECQRHVNRIGLIKFVRANMAQKDWDGYVEIYGIPAAFVVGPPQVPAGKEAEYQAAAEAAAKGGSGYLPNGSTITTADGPRNSQPFDPYLRALSEKLILAGTGGLLTMLAQSGSGTLAGGAHEDTFEQLARAEAKKISRVMGRGFDSEVLEANFPGRPRLAYWELAANEEQDTDILVSQILKLAQAGYQMDPEQIEEKTGYSVTVRSAGGGPSAGNMPSGGAEDGSGPSGQMPAELTNRRSQMQNAATDQLIEKVMEDLSGVQARWLGGVKPFFNRLIVAAKDTSIDDTEYARLLNRAASEMPELFGKLDTATLQGAMERAMGAAAANGMLAGAMQRKSRNGKSRK